PVNQAGQCNWSSWGDAADTAAQNDGVNEANFDNIVYVFPGVQGCGWSRLAYLPGTRSYINGNFITLVVAHEFGHNLGVHHASSYNCSANGKRVPISSSCTSDEYGDPFDTMGNIAAHQMNNFHKGQYGWWGPSNLQTVMQNGTYNLSPIESSSSGLQCLRIPRGATGTYFYLEFRQPMSPFDNFSTTDPVVNGVTIRVAPDFSQIVQSHLIDTTPDTSFYSDSALALNQSVTDPANGITITTTAVSSSGATVQIAFGGSP